MNGQQRKAYTACKQHVWIQLLSLHLWPIQH